MRRGSGNVSEVFVSFQGEGLHAGRRHLFVRFGGCPLRCRWCDTPESLVPVERCRVLGPDGPAHLPNPLDVATLSAAVRRLAACAPPLHAVAVTGGEPLAQIDFLEDWLGGAPPDAPVLLETAGIYPARLARALRHVAIVSLDFKCPSNSGERARWEEHEACVAAAVGAGREVYVKMPVDAATALEEVETGARILGAVDRRVPLFLTPLTEPGSARLTAGAADLERFAAAASRFVDDVRVLPQLHKVLGIL